MRSLIGLAVGLILSLGLSGLAGENPFHVLHVLFFSAFGSFDDFALSAFYATSLMFTGLSVALSFRAGLFNIGAEGQLTAACLASTASALFFEKYFPGLASSPFVAFTVAVGSSVVAGGIWALIPAVIKTYRGGHEVITTMMMNFVAAGLMNYLVVGPLRSESSQSPETASVSGSFLFSTWDPIHQALPSSPLNLAFIVAIFL